MLAQAIPATDMSEAIPDFTSRCLIRIKLLEFIPKYVPKCPSVGYPPQKKPRILLDPGQTGIAARSAEP